MSHRILAIQGEVNLQSLYYSKVLYKKYRKHIKSLKESSIKSKLMRMPAECENFNVVFDVEDFTFSVHVSENSAVKIPTQITEIDLYKSQLCETIEKANSILDKEKYSLNNVLFTEIKTIKESVENNLAENALDFSKFDSMFKSDRASLLSNDINEVFEIKNPFKSSNAHSNVKAIAETAIKHFTIGTAIIASGAPVSKENIILYSIIFGGSFLAKKAKKSNTLGLARNYPKTMKALSLPAEAGEKIYEFMQSNNKVTETFMSVMKTLRSKIFKIPFIDKKDNLASFIADGLVDSNNLTANISGRNKIDLSTVKFKEVLNEDDLKIILERLGYDKKHEIKQDVVKSFIENPTLSSLFFGIIASGNFKPSSNKKPAERNKKSLAAEEAKLEELLGEYSAFKLGNNIIIEKNSKAQKVVLKAANRIQALCESLDYDQYHLIDSQDSLKFKDDPIMNNFDDLNKNDIKIMRISDRQDNNKRYLAVSEGESEKTHYHDFDVNVMTLDIYDKTYINIKDFFNRSDDFNNLVFDDIIDITEYYTNTFSKKLRSNNEKQANDDSNDTSGNVESQLKRYTKSYIESLKILQDSISGKGSFYHALDYLLEKGPSKELGVDQILSSLLIESFDVYGFEGMNQLIDGTAQSLGFVNNLTELMNDNQAISKIVSNNRLDPKVLAKEIFKQTSKSYFIDRSINLDKLADDIFNTTTDVSRAIDEFVEKLYVGGDRKPVTKLGKDLEANIFEYLKKIIPKEKHEFDTDEAFFEYIRNHVPDSQALSKFDSAGFWKNVFFNAERGFMTTCFEKTFGKKSLKRVKAIYDTVESNHNYVMHTGNLPDQTSTFGSIRNSLAYITKKTGPVLGSLLIMTQLFGTGAAVVVGGAELHKETRAEVSDSIEKTTQKELKDNQIEINSLAIQGTEFYVKPILDNFIITLSLTQNSGVKKLLESLQDLTVEDLPDDKRDILIEKFNSLCYKFLLDRKANDNVKKAKSLFTQKDNFDEFLVAVNLIQASSDESINKDKLNKFFLPLYLDFHHRLYIKYKENPKAYSGGGNKYYSAIIEAINKFIEKHDGDVNKGILEYSKYCLEEGSDESLASTLKLVKEQNNKVLDIIKDAIEFGRKEIQKDIERLNDAETGSDELPKRTQIAGSGTIAYQARLLNHLNYLNSNDDSLALQAYNFTNLEPIFGESTQEPLKELYGFSENDAAYLDSVYKESKWLSTMHTRIGILLKKQIKHALQRSLSVQIMGGKLFRDIVFDVLEDEVDASIIKEVVNMPVQEFNSHAVDSFYGNYFVTILSFFLTALFGLFISRNKVYSKVQLVKFMSSAVNFGTAHYESILIRKFLISSAENATNCALSISEQIKGGNINNIKGGERSLKDLKKCLRNFESVVIAEDESLTIQDVINNIKTGQRKKKSS